PEMIGRATWRGSKDPVIGERRVVAPAERASDGPVVRGGPLGELSDAGVLQLGASDALPDGVEDGRGMPAGGLRFSGAPCPCVIGLYGPQACRRAPPDDLSHCVLRFDRER